ncbi:hypothetical protein [Halarchaeum nitratireducens]|uniref:Uncharacterized protein n=1 Tax=Halarchaeum nitratireducens TaxID=489913 RepID=A0A830GFN8_9EURY|nr:hypothetical protein [Halarchaeum nitratireducens]GGN24201.1 hypothetical protein GCM10009021_27450 [Halarchaeum nitratireducens]
MSDGDTSARPSRAAIPRTVGICVAAAAAAWGAFVPAVAVPPPIQDAVAVFAFALALWLTDALPYVVTSVLTIVLSSRAPISQK